MAPVGATREEQCSWEVWYEHHCYFVAHAWLMWLLLVHLVFVWLRAMYFGASRQDGGFEAGPDGGVLLLAFDAVHKDPCCEILQQVPEC